MATLTASKWGFIQGPQNASFTTARNATTGTATANPTNATTAIEFRYQGRGTPLNSFRRCFFYFDTTNVTGAPTSATINLEGNTIVSDTAGSILVRAIGAFGGDGSSDLADADFNNTAFHGDGYDFSGIYNSWTTSGTNNISLNSTAMNHMQSSNHLLCCLMQYGNDYRGASATSVGTVDNLAIDFSTTPTITHNGTVTSAGGPENIEKYNTFKIDKVEKINTIAFSSIEEINGIS